MDTQTIKQKVLGNDREKTFVDIAGIVSLLQNAESPIVLRNASIIIQSFSYTKTNADILMGNNIVKVLIESSVKNSQLLDIHSRTLVNVLSHYSESLVNLSCVERGEELIDILKDTIQGNSSESAVFDACVLVAFLSSKNLITLYVPIMERLSFVLAPTILGETDGDVEAIPLLFALSRLIDMDDSIEIPHHFCTCMSTLLKSSSWGLKLAAADVLTSYCTQNKQFRKLYYIRLIPPLVDLIDNSLEATSVLPHSVTPLHLLSKLCQQDDSFIDHIAGNAIIEKMCDIITSSYPSKDLSKNILYRVSDSLVILGGISSHTERFRDQIVKFDLSGILIDILNRYVNIINEFSSNCPENEQCKYSIYRLSNSLTTSACYLIRSLSRSTSLLRTYLADIDLVNVLVSILGIATPEWDTYLEGPGFNDELLKTIVLGIISNVIIEFSPSRANLVDTDIISVLAAFLAGAQSDGVKSASLSVIRNYLYGNDDIGKKDFLVQKISLNQIFELCYHKSSKIKLQCFNIIRNLTYGSLNYSDKILCEFPKCAAAVDHGDGDFLSFLCNNICLETTSGDCELAVAINYIIVHLAASNEANRSLIAAHDRILEKLRDFLEDPRLNQHIKLSSIWLVINLTWKDDTSRMSDDEDTMDVDQRGYSSEYLSSRARAAKLIRMGFYDTIKRLSIENDELDIKERARTAIFQLGRLDDSRLE